MIDKLAAPDIAKAIINVKGGPTKLNKYRIILPTMFVGGDAISMDILCRGATLPGRSVNVMERRTNMKPIETPMGYINTPVDLVFTETNDHTVNHYFNIWMDRTVNPDTYEVAWRDNCVEDVLIMSNDDSGIPGYIVKLKSCFPKVKNQIDLADTSADSVVEVRVQLAYEDYEVIDGGLLAGATDFARALRTGSIPLPTNTIRRATEGLF